MIKGQLKRRFPIVHYSGAQSKHRGIEDVPACTASNLPRWKTTKARADVTCIRCLAYMEKNPVLPAGSRFVIGPDINIGILGGSLDEIRAQITETFITPEPVKPPATSYAQSKFIKPSDLFRKVKK